MWNFIVLNLHQTLIPVTLQVLSSAFKELGKMPLSFNYLFKVHMAPHDTVAKCPLRCFMMCSPTVVFKSLKFPPLIFTYECLNPVTKGVVLGLTSDVHVRPFASVMNRLLPCKSYGSFKLFKISASDFNTVGMRRRFYACTYKFLTMVTEGVVHGVHKVVIRSSFGVIW